MEYINILLAYCFELIITILFANRLMVKKMKTHWICVFGLIPFAISYILFFWLHSTIVNNVTSLLMYFSIMAIGYKDKIIKKCVYTIYLSVLMYSSEMIWTIPIHKSGDLITIITDTRGQLTMIVITKLIFFIASQLMVLIIQYKDFNNNKKYLPLFIFPLASNMFLVAFLYICGKTDISDGFYWFIEVLCILVSITSVLLFPYYQKMDEKDRKLKELEKEQQFVELNNSYMQVLEHQNNDMRMLAHDTKNHYTTIANMDSIEDVKEYISNVVDEVQSYQIIRLTDNKMLDLLLSKYKVECNSKGIKLNTEIKTANLNYIDDSDLSILICNLLDNAIESAEQSKTKAISFSLRKINGFDMLNVINSCDIEPTVKNKTIATSKADKSAHGYGMKIISKYANKNNAEYEWYYDNNTNTFNSTLIFKR